LVINDCRVAGPKPWGGGRVIHAFDVDALRIEEAIGVKTTGQNEAVDAALKYSSILKGELPRLIQPEPFIGHVLALADEVRRLLELTRWRPIETAPKDGSDVLLYYKMTDHVRIREGHYYKDEETGISSFPRYYIAEMDECLPAYWMPLPAALGKGDAK
jgi:hypothetical protein